MHHRNHTMDVSTSLCILHAQHAKQWKQLL